VLDSPGHGHQGFLAGVELAPVVELLGSGDDELLDGVLRVVPVDQPEVVVVGAEDVTLLYLTRRFGSTPATLGTSAWAIEHLLIGQARGERNR
jgi:hypothetical protein